MRARAVLTAVLLSACGRSEPPKAPAPPAKTSDAVAVKSEGCRALVNLADGRSLDLRFGPRVSARLGDALVVRDGARSYALRSEGVHREGKSKGGTGTADWNKLLIAELPGGTPRVWQERPAELSLPEDDGFGGSEHDNGSGLSITGIAGPFVSIEHAYGGYTGGAHPFQGLDVFTLRVPGSEAVRAVLDEASDKALGAELARANREREKSEFSEDIPPPSDPTHVGFRVWRGDAGGVRLLTSLDCCSYAENGGHHDVELPLARVPKALAPHLRFSADALHLVEDAEGRCGLGMQKGQLIARSARGAAPTPIDVPGLGALEEAALLGVTWLVESDPFDLAQLPRRWDAGGTVEKVPAAQEAAFTARLPKGSTLAHALFRAPLLGEPRAVLALYHQGKELEGMVLSEAAEGRSIKLPSLLDADAEAVEVRAVILDDLDDDASREPVIMLRLKSAQGAERQHNVVLDDTGDGFVRRLDLEAKIEKLETAKLVRAALR